MLAPQAELRELARQLKARLEDGDLPLSSEPSGRRTAAAPAAASPQPGPLPQAGEEGPVPQAGGADRAAPPAAPAAAGDRWEELAAEVSACRKCPLGAQRLNAVFGVGSRNAAVMFIGEGPGFQEDHDGEPFVGKAGKLLDDILKAIGLSRQTVYIANMVKCHPMVDPSDPEARGNDRPPAPEEIDACRPFLEEQIRLIQPRYIVTLGNVSTKALLRTETGITKMRGQWRPLEVPGLSRPVPTLPTYHPAALLRDPGLKRDVWTDMKNLRDRLASENV